MHLTSSESIVSTNVTYDELKYRDVLQVPKHHPHPHLRHGKFPHFLDNHERDYSPQKNPPEKSIHARRNLDIVCISTRAELALRQSEVMQATTPVVIPLCVGSIDIISPIIFFHQNDVTLQCVSESPLISKCILTTTGTLYDSMLKFISIFDTASKVHIDGVTFQSVSTQHADGAALSIIGNGPHTITRCTFQDNTNRFGRGGALSIISDTVVLGSQTTVIIDESIFIGNENLNGQGGGFYSQTRVALSSCEFTNNEALKGGAAFLFGGDFSSITGGGNVATQCNDFFDHSVPANPCIPIITVDPPNCGEPCIFDGECPNICRWCSGTTSLPTVPRTCQASPCGRFCDLIGFPTIGCGDDCPHCINNSCQPNPPAGCGDVCTVDADCSPECPSCNRNSGQALFGVCRASSCDDRFCNSNGDCNGICNQCIANRCERPVVNPPTEVTQCIGTEHRLQEELRDDLGHNFNNRIVTLCPGTLIVTEELFVNANNWLIRCAGNPGTCTLRKRDRFNAYEAGRILTASGRSFQLEGISFENGNVGRSNNGGAVLLIEGGGIDRCTFRNNHAGHGGGIYAHSSDVGDTFIVESTFVNNKANQGASGWIEDGIRNNVFEDAGYSNRAVFCDGVVLSRPDGITECVFLEERRFNENACIFSLTEIRDRLETASEGERVEVCPGDYKFSDAITVTAKYIYLVCLKDSGSPCRFYYETQGQNAPFLIFETGGCTIDGFTFQNGGNSKQNGGAVAIDGKDLHENIKNTFLNCVFRNNIAKNGGAIYAARSTSLNIVDCEFNNNAASQQGGMIWMDFHYGSVAICNPDSNNYARQCKQVYDTQSGNCRDVTAFSDGGCTGSRINRKPSLGNASANTPDLFEDDIYLKDESSMSYNF